MTRPRGATGVAWGGCAGATPVEFGRARRCGRLGVVAAPWSAGVGAR